MAPFVDIITIIHKKKLFLIPVILSLLLLCLSFFNRVYEIVPGFSENYIEAFNDSADNGNSEIDSFKIDHNGITLGYTLRDKCKYAYTGLKLILKRGNRYKDISAYDFFSIQLQSNTPQEFNIYFHTIIPGFTDEAKVLSYRYLEKPFKTLNEVDNLTFSIKNFIVPSWWYVLNKYPVDSLKRETFKQVAEIIIENGYSSQINTPYSFTVKRLYLHKNMIKRGLWTFGVCIGWLLIYSIIYLLTKNIRNQTEKKVVISYHPLDIENNSDEDLNRIVSYIAKKYNDPTLTVSKIATDVGLLPAKITQILREKKNCSYKQYLNSIRLAEAKRLLMETDRNIIDIALKVGYNNVTHFNRIFKESEDVSPRQFRSGVSASKK
ncbi:MAG: helix-turn-helix transcriptional regulator [Fibrobacter sp.]|nr:helix-turn-helix transcriptional regulator [Fibrobacter sp.]